MKTKAEQIVEALPDTEQGLMDYVRYAEREIKVCSFRIKKLTRTIEAARTQLIIKGKCDDTTMAAINA